MGWGQRPAPPRGENDRPAPGVRAVGPGSARQRARPAACGLSESAKSWAVGRGDALHAWLLLLGDDPFLSKNGDDGAALTGRES